MDKKIFLLLLLGIIQLTSCQNMKEEEKRSIPFYYVEMSHSGNEHLFTPIIGEITTLEGNIANFPYGSSSGSWGSSGAFFSKQSGTPTGFDVTYYAESEDAFYHLKTTFPTDTVVDWTQRAYAVNFSSNPNAVMQPYINTIDTPDYDEKYNLYYESYVKFNSLVFGFAPKGMVVVWFGYGPIQIELGAYQAKLITDPEIINQYKNFYAKKFDMTREWFDELAIRYHLPNETPHKWIKYRTRYPWALQVTSNNPAFKLHEIVTSYYNAEFEVAMLPWVTQIPISNRAIPKETQIFYETKNGEKFEARFFFDWETANAAFKKVNGPITLHIKMASNNTSFEVLLNNEPIETSGRRIYGEDGYDIYSQ